MTEHAVIVAGGGPTGLMLAAELALASIDVAIVERRPNQDLAGMRAGGLHARTIEVLDQRGVADRFLSQGKKGPATSFGWIPLDLSGQPTRFDFVLALRQAQIEQILADWVAELGAPTYRNHEVTGFTQDDTGVSIATAGGRGFRAAYLVGCDGGRSVIRKVAEIDFPGWDPTISNLIAEVQLAEEPEWGTRRDALGLHGLGKLENGKTVRVMVTEQRRDRREEPTLRDLSDALIAVYGTDFGVHSPISISRFTDMARQAAAYRSGRVLLAGDAAHIHYPVGGQGLNLGVQDAVNLGWKLAQVVRQISPQRLLDTYQAERYPVGATVLRNTMAQVELLRTDDHTNALREIVSELLGMEEPRTRFGAMMAGLDVRYNLGEGHPLLGRRMPDLDLETADGPRRVFELMRDARPLLLDFGSAVELDITPWIDRVPKVRARAIREWELPVLGRVEAPSAVLVRPDGYVAWVSNGSEAGLQAAMTAWFGEP